jgi:1-acyl-sn-glycerol-3-phosphate acyltransferase
VEIAAFIIPVVLAGSLQLAFSKAGLLGQLGRPIDGGRSFRGQRLFGDNKTWRGALLMITITPLATVLVHQVYASLGVVAHTFMALPSFWLGLVMGIAYILGELPNSFIKRQLGVAPGKSSQRLQGLQYVVDQADSVIAVCVALVLTYSIPAQLALALFCVGVVVHIVFDHAMHLLGAKKRWDDPPLAGIRVSFLQLAVWPLLVFLLRVVFRGKVNNQIKLPGGSGNKFIMAANHQSGLDPFMITAAFRLFDIARLLPFRYLTANKYLFSPKYSWLLRPLGGFPAYQDPRQLFGIERANVLLAKGHTVCIFPEGKRTLSKATNARSGIKHLAHDEKTYIIPLHISWKRSGFLNRRIQLTIGQPFSALGVEPEEVMKRIYELPLGSQRYSQKAGAQNWQDQVIETS